MAAEFNIQTIVTNYLNSSYGLTSSFITSKFPQAILIGRNNPQDVIAFNNA
jgi:nicotinamidase-related amidase